MKKCNYEINRMDVKKHVILCLHIGKRIVYVFFILRKAVNMLTAGKKQTVVTLIYAHAYTGNILYKTSMIFFFFFVIEKPNLLYLQ